MDQFWLGAGAIAGLAVVISIVWVVWRIRKLESATIKALETVKDDQIKIRVHSLSDAELNALLVDSLKSRDPKT